MLRAALFTLAGYGCLTLYDALAVRFAGARVPYPRIALISFMGYAIGHNVGLNTLSGGAIRYRAYSALGLGAKQIATIIAFGTVTFLLGAGLLLGLSLLTQAGMSGSVLHVHASIAILAGVALLGAVAAYLWLVCTRHEPLRYRSIVIPVPKPRVAFAQIAVACADLLCAAGVLYVLLPPQAAIGFAAFAGIYLIAIAAGIISNVPGGIGVFETVLLLLLQSVPKDHLLGALVAYRIIYYFAPFAVALALLGAHELWAHRGPMVRMVQLGAHLAERRDPAGHRDRGVRGGRRAAVLRRHAGTRQPPGSAARLPAAAHPRIVAPARQRRGRRSAGDGARPVSAARCGVVADDLAAVRRRSIVAPQGLRLRRGARSSALVVVALVSARDALSTARLADRTALFGALDHRAGPGAGDRGLAGDVRLSARAVRQ